MNSATYEIALPDDFKAFYFEETEITLACTDLTKIDAVAEW